LSFTEIEDNNQNARWDFATGKYKKKENLNFLSTEDNLMSCTLCDLGDPVSPFYEYYGSK
jgi:hypothetical protein